MQYQKRYMERARLAGLRKALVRKSAQLDTIEWENLQDETLYGIVNDLMASAGDKIRAMDAITKRREYVRFGDRGAVEETKAECEKRIEELKKLLAWGRENGVTGEAGVGRLSIQEKGDCETPAGADMAGSETRDGG